MKVLNACVFCLAAVFIFSAPGFSQQQPAVRAQERRGSLPAGMEELRELVRNYHETEDEAGKAEIRSALRKILEERQFAGHARAIERLKSLDEAAAAAERDARRLGDERLKERIASLRTGIKEMLRDNVSERDDAVAARLERLLSPRRERERPERR